MKMNTCFFATLVLFLLVVGYGAGAQQQPSTNSTAKPLVLRGGLLIDGTGKAPLQNSVIVIAAGKIQSVGAEGSVTVPSDATVINTTGKTIIPGLVDSHVHYDNFMAPQLLYWGVTAIGDMGTPRGWILAVKEAVEKGRAVGPYIMTVGNAITSPPRAATNDGSGFVIAAEFLSGNARNIYVSDEASLEAAIAEAKKLGVDAVKLREPMDPRLEKAAPQIAHRYGLPVFLHTASTGVGMDELLDAGLDLHVHLAGLNKAAVSPDIRERIVKGERFEVTHLLDTSKFPALAQGMVDKKMFLNPELGGPAAKYSRHLEEFDRANTAFLQGPMGAVLPEEDRVRALAAYKPHRGQHSEEVAEGYRRLGAFMKELVQRGGKVIAGSGASVNPAEESTGLSLHVEMRLLEEAGLTPMQALQAATSWGMEAWGKSKEAGTIEPGKRADLVILNRNPLEDLTATRDISQVIQGGKVVDREALARWKDPLPRPTPFEARHRYVTLIRTPFVDELSPESFRVNQRNAPELILQGEQFTPRSQVLFNDRLVPAKFYSETRLGISISEDMLREAGTIPVVVVQPGSGGGVSNMMYVIVAPD